MQKLSTRTTINAEQATVRIGATLAIPDVLASLGADPAKVLAELGLDTTLFDDPDIRISYAARGRLVNHCAVRTNCAHFGLLLGQRGKLEGFGLVGYLVKYAPDVGAALRSLIRYLHLHAQGAAVHLDVTGNQAVLSYAILLPRTPGAYQIGDAAVAMAYNFLRELCGSNWKATEVRFTHRKPTNVAPYRRFFQAPLVFDAEQNAVAFPANWLNLTLPKTDPELRRILQKQIDLLESQHGEDFKEQVRGVLQSVLLTGHSSADQVAALFSMHSRTLNRRLNFYGSSFKVLADEGRYAIARQLLESSELGVAQISDTLNYADARAFTRAFRRWSGTSPGRWRAMQIGDTQRTLGTKVRPRKE